MKFDSLIGHPGGRAFRLRRNPATPKCAGARRLLRCERGQALIEFAVFLPMLLFTISAIVDYAMYIQAEIQMQAAAAVGAEYGIYPGNTSDTSGMESSATYAANHSGMSVSNFSVTASDEYSCTAGGTLQSTPPACSGNAPYEFVQVSTSGTFSALMGFTKLPASLTLYGFAQYEVQ
jgi:Flp pilus assembly protein TadG